MGGLEGPSGRGIGIGGQDVKSPISEEAIDEALIFQKAATCDG